MPWRRRAQVFYYNFSRRPQLPPLQRRCRGLRVSFQISPQPNSTPSRLQSDQCCVGLRSLRVHHFQARPRRHALRTWRPIWIDPSLPGPTSLSALASCPMNPLPAHRYAIPRRHAIPVACHFMRCPHRMQTFQTCGWQIDSCVLPCHRTRHACVVSAPPCLRRFLVAARYCSPGRPPAQMLPRHILNSPRAPSLQPPLCSERLISYTPLANATVSQTVPIHCCHLRRPLHNPSK